MLNLSTPHDTETFVSSTIFHCANPECRTPLHIIARLSTGGNAAFDEACYRIGNWAPVDFRSAQWFTRLRFRIGTQVHAAFLPRLSFASRNSFSTTALLCSASWEL